LFRFSRQKRRDCFEALIVREKAGDLLKISDIIGGHMNRAAGS